MIRLGLLIIYFLLNSCSMGTIIGNGNKSDRPDANGQPADNDAQTIEQKFEPENGNEPIVNDYQSAPVYYGKLFAECGSPFSDIATGEFTYVGLYPSGNLSGERFKMISTVSEVEYVRGESENDIFTKESNDELTFLGDEKSFSVPGVSGYDCSDWVDIADPEEVDGVSFKIREIILTSEGNSTKLKIYISSDDKVHFIKLFQRIDNELDYFYKFSLEK